MNEFVEIEDEEYRNQCPRMRSSDQQIADVLTFVRNSFE
jgi:hypothetical protein